MSNNRSTYETVRLAYQAIFQRPIAYLPVFADAMGSVAGGVFLSQLVYWSSTKDGGWFYKTDEEIRAETRLTDRELRAAKRDIKKIHGIECKRKGLPARTWYRVDLVSLVESLDIHSPALSSSDDGVQTGGHDGVRTLPDDAVQTTPREYTESTTERNTQRVNGHRRKDLPCPEGVSPEVWADFLRHRKNIKAPLTATAWKRMAPELEAAAREGWDRDDALAEAMAAGWRGLKAEWLRNRCQQKQQDNSPFAGAL